MSARFEPIIGLAVCRFGFRQEYLPPRLGTVRGFRQFSDQRRLASPRGGA